MKIDWAHFLYKIKALKSDRYGCKEGSQTLNPQAIHYIAAFML
ncbi:hypothetical protein EYZ11_010866 [Aspergillus tanneri]|uniref:Uncharacterized protein n=1 Tax=Aspergillus tanneri TaxID=1220188 RepID=A0A4S3J9Q3_9EURO|nr:hypothetical protein EYZ11_010866 [Aspergillus tanneri]